MANLLKRLLEAVVILGVVYMLSGCHTVHGVGQDLKDFTSKYVERD
jgi:predicted small secreted protein